MLKEKRRVLQCASETDHNTEPFFAVFESENITPKKSKDFQQIPGQFYQKNKKYVHNPRCGKVQMSEF